MKAKPAGSQKDRFERELVFRRLDQLEKRILEMENKFFAFQCGAQAQMVWDRIAIGGAPAMPEPPKEEGEEEEGT